MAARPLDPRAPAGRGRLLRQRPLRQLEPGAVGKFDEAAEHLHLAFVADTLSNKLLHGPSSALRKADAVEQALLLSAARKLFGLPEEGD